MIDPNAFIQRLNRTKTISPKLSEAIAEGLRLNTFERHETFLSPGNYCNSIYFIQKGLVRGAIEGPSEKMTTWFKQEGEIIIPSGCLKQQPSEEYLNAVENTNLLSISINHIRKVFRAFPEEIELLILLISETIQQSEYREKLLRIPAAKDRYLFMIEKEDFILKRIPHNLIASYLNITKETFSRINKGLDY